MQVLFLDIATRTGWALAEPAARTGRLSGSKTFAVTAETTTQRHARLCVRFCDWLSDILQETGARRLVIERAGGSPHMGEAGRVLLGLNLAALGIAEVRGLSSEEVTSSAWKKLVCGHGMATKPQVMQAVRQLGYSPASQDEADALGLRHYWLRQQEIAAATAALPIDLPAKARPRRRPARRRSGELPGIAA